MYYRLAAGTVPVFLALSTWALAGECPGNPDAIGTSRVIALDPAKHQRLGLQQYRETLPLQDHEVVLTFDDGPLPPYTSKVLDALAAECVKANFFVVGEMARANPALVQREYREGHTIGTHSEHHRYLTHLSAKAATKEIEDGIASARMALGGAGAVAPFFRFPFLDPPASKEALALKLGLSIWSVDLDANDWYPIASRQVLAFAIRRLERAKKGMLLLHDTEKRTAIALPALLRELKKRGYRIAHVIPADSEHPATEAIASEWTSADDPPHYPPPEM
jgi:peptidoglycan-N-acetylglucosamine deacetylase